MVTAMMLLRTRKLSFPRLPFAPVLGETNPTHIRTSVVRLGLSIVRLQLSLPAPRATKTSKVQCKSRVLKESPPCKASRTHCVEQRTTLHATCQSSPVPCSWQLVSLFALQLRLQLQLLRLQRLRLLVLAFELPPVSPCVQLPVRCEQAVCVAL